MSFFHARLSRRNLMKLSRHTLVQILVGKSVIEAILVAAIAAAFYLTTTNPGLRGSVDQVTALVVSGWAVDQGNAGRRVEVQLFIDDKFVGQTLASEFRPDVHQARSAVDDWHGFVFRTPTLEPGEHEAKVFATNHGAAARRTLQMIGTPRRFSVGSTSTIDTRGGSGR